MAFEDIGKEVGQNMDAYRSNPQALEQQIKPAGGRMGAQAGGAGISQPLIKLLALQKLKEEQKNKEQEIAMSLQNQNKTVRNKLEEDAIDRSISETTQGVMGALKQKQMARMKAQNRLLKNATRFNRPTTPMGMDPRMAMMRQQGVAGVPRKNAPTQFAARGGIVGYYNGGSPTDDSLYTNKNQRWTPEMMDLASKRNREDKRKEALRKLQTDNALYTDKSFVPERDTGLSKRLSEMKSNIFNVPGNIRNALNNASSPTPNTENAAVDVTAPDNEIITEIDEVVKKAYDPERMMDINEIPSDPLVIRQQKIKEAQERREENKRGDDDEKSGAGSPTGPSTQGLGSIASTYQELYDQVMADRQSEDPWAKWKYLTARGLDPRNIGRAASDFENREMSIARDRVNTIMELQNKQLDRDLKLQIAQIAAGARAASKGQLTEYQRASLLMDAQKLLTDLKGKLVSNPNIPGSGGDQIIHALYRKAYIKDKDVEGGIRIDEPALRELEAAIDNHPAVVDLNNQIRKLSSLGGSIPTSDLDPNNKEVTQVSP